MAHTAMPTLQRLARAGSAFEVGGDGRTGKVIRMLDAPLERLYSEGKVIDAHYEVLRRLRLHWYLGRAGGSMAAMDLDRVSASDHGALAHSERELLHREAFDIGWRALQGLERSVVHGVVLIETGLTNAGAELGYRSPYRGRAAALELLQSGAQRLLRAW